MDGDLDRFGTHLARVHRLGARRKHRRIGIDSTKEGKFDFLKGKDVIPRQIVLEEIKNSQGKLFSFGSFFISCQSIFYLVSLQDLKRTFHYLKPPLHDLKRTFQVVQRRFISA